MKQLNLVVAVAVSVIFACNVNGLGLGDNAYVHHGDDRATGKHFALVVIEDERGDKVRIKAKGNCFKSTFQGKGCYGYDFSFNQYKVGELYWVDKSRLTTSWEDKL